MQRLGRRGINPRPTAVGRAFMALRPEFSEQRRRGSEPSGGRECGTLSRGGKGEATAREKGGSRGHEEALAKDEADTPGVTAARDAGRPWPGGRGVAGPIRRGRARGGEGPD